MAAAEFLTVNAAQYAQIRTARLNINRKKKDETIKKKKELTQPQEQDRFAVYPKMDEGGSYFKTYQRVCQV